MKQISEKAVLPQYPEPYWLADGGTRDFPKLDEDIHVDTAIVGGGMTGIATAYLLSQKGLKVAVIEAGRLLQGTTGHTTAKITAQHDLIYDELLSHFGREKTRLYYDANIEALQFIKRMVTEHQIDCQFTEENAYMYTESDSLVQKIAAEYRAYETLGIPGSYAEQIPLPFRTKAAVIMKDQAQFNPVPLLRYMVDQIIQRGGQIYEHTTVVGATKESPATVRTNTGRTVTCSHVVSCSHFPFNDWNGFYFARLHADRSYVLAAKTDKPYPGGMYLSAETPKRSLRSVLINGEPMVLIGGEGHKTGQGICTHKHYEELLQFGEETFGLKEIAYRWSTQDLYTLDKIPYIGQQTSDVPHIFIATGYKKWGMTTSIAAALLNSRLIAGEESPYRELFSPSRFHADPDIKTFVAQNANVAGHLIAGKLEWSFKSAQELKPDEAAVIRVKGKRAGAYRDLQGALHVVDTTCSHLGCEVEWNKGDRTWDCPCHGSRYSYQGEVIEGPAKKALGKIEAD